MQLKTATQTLEFGLMDKKIADIPNVSDKRQSAIFSVEHTTLVWFCFLMC